MKHYLFSTLRYALLLFITTACSKGINGDTNTNYPGGPVTDDHPGKYNVSVTTIAGKAGDHGNAEDGNGANARLWNPTKMIFDNRDNVLYVADGNTIGAIDQQNNVTTYLPLGRLSGFNEITDIDIAPGTIGGTLYFTTKENDLCKIEPDGNAIKLTKTADRIYGGNETGPLNSADHFDGAYGVATGKDGEIYFFNTAWNTMHGVTLSATDPAAGMVSPFTGKPVAARGGNAWPFRDGQGEQALMAAQYLILPLMAMAIFM